MEAISWKNGYALPAGNFSDLVPNVPARPFAGRGHVNESADSGGKKPSCAWTRTIGKTNEVLSKPGVPVTLSTGVSIAGRTPTTASATGLNSKPAATLKQSSVLQRWTRQSPLVP